MLSSSAFEQRLDYIQERIHLASMKAGRNPKNITLVAITKAFPAEIWKRALRANLNTLGESRIQEAQGKSDIFLQRDKIELHFIGHLQSNKAQKAVKLFDVIQTVDSIKLANQLDHICGKVLKKQAIFIQVNAGADPKKHGVSVENVTSVTREISKMKNLKLCGIMTIPPRDLTETELSQVYRKTRKIRDEICNSINDQCKNISMGMSGDYEIAITEGSTHVRIGTGLFGPRQ